MVSSLIVIRGQPRGLGFVETSNDRNAEKAITALNGNDLDGRALNVNQARPKPDRGHPGGARYGRQQKRW